MATGWGHEAGEKASDLALENCHKRKDKGAPQAAKRRRLIATFHNECYAVSLDPKEGTPGAGFGDRGR